MDRSCKYISTSIFNVMTEIRALNHRYRGFVGRFPMFDSFEVSTSLGIELAS